MADMKLVPTVQKPLIRLPTLSPRSLYASILEFYHNLTRPQTVIIVSVGSGLALVGLVARYLRRRRRSARKSALTRPDNPNRSHRKSKPITIRSPSGEIYSTGGNISPGFHRTVHRQSSVSSDRTSVASALTAQAANGSTLTPQQYG
ncbi:hypothetical protein SK128_020839, partial [Halocaridina rubra]